MGHTSQASATYRLDVTDTINAAWYVDALSLHFQCVKLVSAHSKKGSTFLNYIVGNRVLLYASRAMENEVVLNKLLRYTGCTISDTIELSRACLKTFS